MSSFQVVRNCLLLALMSLYVTTHIAPSSLAQMERDSVENAVDKDPSYIPPYMYSSCAGLVLLYEQGADPVHPISVSDFIDQVVETYQRNHENPLQQSNINRVFNAMEASNDERAQAYAAIMTASGEKQSVMDGMLKVLVQREMDRRSISFRVDMIRYLYYSLNSSKDRMDEGRTMYNKKVQELHDSNNLNQDSNLLPDYDFEQLVKENKRKKDLLVALHEIHIRNSGALQAHADVWKFLTNKDSRKDLYEEIRSTAIEAAKPELFHKEDTLQPLAEFVHAIWDETRGFLTSDWTMNRRIFRRSKKRLGRHCWRHWIQYNLLQRKSDDAKRATKRLLETALEISAYDEDKDNAVSNGVVRRAIKDLVYRSEGLYQLPYSVSEN